MRPGKEACQGILALVASLCDHHLLWQQDAVVSEPASHTTLSLYVLQVRLIISCHLLVTPFGCVATRCYLKMLPTVSTCIKTPRAWDTTGGGSYLHLMCIQILGQHIGIVTAEGWEG